MRMQGLLLPPPLLFWVVQAAAAVAAVAADESRPAPRRQATDGLTGRVPLHYLPPHRCGFTGIGASSRYIYSSQSAAAQACINFGCDGLATTVDLSNARYPSFEHVHQWVYPNAAENCAWGWTASHASNSYIFMIRQKAASGCNKGPGLSSRSSSAGAYCKGCPPLHVCPPPPAPPAAPPAPPTLRCASKYLRPGSDLDGTLASQLAEYVQAPFVEGIRAFSMWYYADATQVGPQATCRKPRIANHRTRPSSAAALPTVACIA